MFEFMLWLGGYWLGAIGTAYFFARVGVHPDEASMFGIFWPIILPVILPYWAANKGQGK